MATHPDKEWNQPLQPGRTQPEPTPFPEPMQGSEPNIPNQIRSRLRRIEDQLAPASVSSFYDPDQDRRGLRVPRVNYHQSGRLGGSAKEPTMSNDHDIDVLNSLITTTIDSANGFERSAEQAEAGPYEDLFRDFAGERRRVIGGLQQSVRALGGDPNDDGSLKAELHRRWLDLRAAFAGDGGDRAVIQEVERGEDYLKGKYEEALEDTELSETARNAIRNAYESVRAGHDTASVLKNRLETAET
jgi:uncharacterized protein (TIGR02284 family)